MCPHLWTAGGSGRTSQARREDTSPRLEAMGLWTGARVTRREPSFANRSHLIQPSHPIPRRAPLRTPPRDRPGQHRPPPAPPRSRRGGPPPEQAPHPRALAHPPRCQVPPWRILPRSHEIQVGVARDSRAIGAHSGPRRAQPRAETHRGRERGQGFRERPQICVKRTFHRKSTSRHLGSQVNFLATFLPRIKFSLLLVKCSGCRTQTTAGGHLGVFTMLKHAAGRWADVVRGAGKVPALTRAGNWGMGRQAELGTPAARRMLATTKSMGRTNTLLEGLKQGKMGDMVRGRGRVAGWGLCGACLHCGPVLARPGVGVSFLLSSVERVRESPALRGQRRAKRR